MIEPSRLTALLIRFLLVGSFLIFAAGATPPAIGGVWGAPLEDELRWIAANPAGWRFSASLFAVSLVMCVAGLSLFIGLPQPHLPQSLNRIAFTVFGLGAVMWIISMAFRLGATPWAAEFLARTGTVPEAYAPLRLLEERLFDVFMLSGFLGSALFGLAMLVSPQASMGAGWFATLYGLGGAALFAISRGPIPIMVLVVPLMLGLSRLTRP